MDFDAALHLQRATGRGHSDVANKLVSMLLHDISRRVNAAAGSAISDASYRQAVIQAFDRNCLYCGRTLEKDRLAVEHLEGMNRIRVGLHIPGNVAVACVTCNREKRRDDTNLTTALADSGWESFLSHDGNRCPATCRGCAYWAAVWPNQTDRALRLHAAINRIRAFRLPFQPFIAWNARHRPAVRDRIETLYRECQAFATRGLEDLAASAILDFEGLKSPPV